jgi:ABC-2 type transport system ATP-binding protein
VQRESDETGRVTGLIAARIGELAHRHRIVLHELTPQTSSLESVFMSLTADSVEYLAGDAR